ncbi:hypothetical protein NYQ10_06150 [Flavobacterium johnsoniae]|uniref:YcxB family protein n=1 Tax=Flavobacterium johnsoniae TaxID=986 RepID=UPI0025AFFFC9|nr:YcxB family protein [Flavobacterium johnsoniae]WJS96035.1 hypothetical protein NYQ10_06150 [Flavobacterium johnsoniae]
MELNYSLTENDYLQQQLYLASKSEQIKKQRRITKTFVILVLVILGFFLYVNENLLEAYCCGVTAVIYFFLFPFYQKKFYQRVFKKYVIENFKNRIGIVTKIKFKEDVLEVFNEGIGKSEFNFSVLKNISEIKDYFFIAFKTGESFMIPKLQIGNIEELRCKLKSIAENLKIDFISELDWKWK